ncbi:MAG: outer membrane lipoprotein carrier protein LolA [Candidatus Kapabacteria bacterium]|nr:outer membrane lipoprotein carrier protein LolA [Ignavibacteriota bacterium]MCW5885046.1 outer membrane lipoprotein carrier protein LolA [Candidatus Kapabacteria bacterium]
MLKLILNIAILVIFAKISLFSQMDKDKLFENIKTKYSNLNSLSLNFVLNENSAIKGELIAKKGNKYVLSVSGRKIYCDGETIWNYVPENKNVLISNFESHGETASIERILFEFTNNFVPLKLYKNQTTYGKSVHTLELVPGSEQQDDITMIKLDMNTDTHDIYQISIIRNYAEESWRISNLKINPKIADNQFNFVPKDDVELIDLR